MDQSCARVHGSTSLPWRGRRRCGRAFALCGTHGATSSCVWVRTSAPVLSVCLSIYLSVCLSLVFAFLAVVACLSLVHAGFALVACNVDACLSLVLAGLAVVARCVDACLSLVPVGLALVARCVDACLSLVFAGLAVVARCVDACLSLVFAGLTVVARCVDARLSIHSPIRARVVNTVIWIWIIFLSRRGVIMRLYGLRFWRQQRTTVFVLGAYRQVLYVCMYLSI